MNEERKKIESNVVLVSSKPIVSYILAATRVKERSDNIILKARGKNINTLVNLAEILKREGMEIKEIKTDTEQFKTKEGKDISVSSMELELVKK